MTGDLAQQIRDRLDRLAELPAAFLEVPDIVTPEEIEKWQRAWDEMLAEQPKVQILAQPARFEPVPDLLRAALLALLELHRPETVDYVSVDRDSRVSTDCTECDAGGVPDGWPCTTLRTIAEKLGIEVPDDAR